MTTTQQPNSETEPTFATLVDEQPEAFAAMVRPRWSYAVALKDADDAIAERLSELKSAQARTATKKAGVVKKRTPAAKKAAPRAAS